MRAWTASKACSAAAACSIPDCAEVVPRCMWICFIEAVTQTVQTCTAWSLVVLRLWPCYLWRCLIKVVSVIVQTCTAGP